jgi:hypothetical protein
LHFTPPLPDPSTALPVRVKKPFKSNYCTFFLLSAEWLDLCNKTNETGSLCAIDSAGCLQAYPARPPLPAAP